MTTKRYWHVGVRLLAGVGVACAVVVLPVWPVGLARTQVGARLTTAHPWVGKGQWIRADTHTHTRFSDGNRTVDDVAAQAEKYGCDAVAITDHSSRERGAATPEYAAAIRAARLAHPRLMIVAGVEWNVPPYNSREHVSVLIPESATEEATLAEFKRRFDDFDRIDGTKPRAEDALAWLAQLKGLGAPPVAVYNHPSRKDETSLENVEDMTRWRSGNDIMIGFEGGPGHQGTEPLGSYDAKIKTIDRWDPVVAKPGDGWDTLLQRGIDIHAAAASADFHTDNPANLNDFWPCQFVETWYYAPERSPVGLLRAMHAGTFFGVHGHIAREVEFTATANGLARPAAAGERISAPAGTVINFSVRATVPEVDWRGAPNRLDAIEFITVKPGGVTEQSYPADGSGVRTATHRVTIGTEDVVVRARGRRVVSDGPDLMFYTNAIRVAVRR